MEPTFYKNVGSCYFDRNFLLTNYQSLTVYLSFDVSLLYLLRQREKLSHK